MKKRIISAITTTGKITLGNYIGAIKQIVDYQKDYEVFMFVADLHALTTPFEPKQLQENIRHAAALYLACGLKPESATIFIQSQVKEHANLGWVLSCHTTMGELQRMTQFKDKANIKTANGTEKIPTGILTYPTLMAADILLYDVDIVPVGRDQKQHIELTRNIATRMNNKYGEIFKIPTESIQKHGAKIMDLQDPTKKMSKSSSNAKGYISLLDDVNVARKKIASAITDSLNQVKFDPENQPGVSNLLTIYSVLKNMSMSDCEKQFQGQNYGVLKTAVADVVCELLTTIQNNFKQLINSSKLDDILKEGQQTASKLASQKLALVYKKIGL
ncbi:tryptophan--tRNA ligase [Spiroplasma endosymbiont of Crioceris asparagi]|uniref:tryptophan--tRNA ligase n=1 Tax=Spiroplasma endosymbiont of Crioceris asparagi TaxID=3066286 RepID=UPI0030D21C3E